MQIKLKVSQLPLQLFLSIVVLLANKQLTFDWFEGVFRFVCMCSLTKFTELFFLTPDFPLFDSVPWASRFFLVPTFTSFCRREVALFFGSIHKETILLQFTHSYVISNTAMSLIQFLNIDIVNCSMFLTLNTSNPIENKTYPLRSCCWIHSFFVFSAVTMQSNNVSSSNNYTWMI